MTAAEYRLYWSILTGRPQSEVYVPRDLLRREAAETPDVTEE